MNTPKRGTRTRGKQPLQSSKAADQPQQLELDFRAPVFMITWPDPETQEFWRATAEEPDEFVRRIARFSRAMQAEKPASLRTQES